MKINIKKTLCIFGILLTTPFFTLYAYKTKSITIGGAEWSNDATLKQVFINQSLNVQLTPQIEKILTVDTEVVWDFVSDEDGSIVSTGSTGKVLVFNQQNQLQHELSLDEAEITVIAKSSEQVYFGSGPAGKIFRIAKNKLTSTKTLDSSSKPWLETQEQFVWDIKLNQNELWVATGGEQGKIFRISPSATAMPIPTVVVAEPNITKLMIKKQGGKTYLYFGTSTQGKFYRLDITGLPQNATPEMIGANLTLLFDAGEKDIADFIFINDDIYVVTSGSGAIGKGTVVGAGESATSKINEGGLIEISEKNGNTGEAEGAQGDVSAESFIADFGGTGGGENYLVHINSANNVSFLYRFENKSPMRIGYLAKTKQLYIGILEDAEIYVMPVQKDTLSRVEKIFSKPEATFSDLFVFNDQLYFTIANLGEIYQLQERLPTQGVYVSRVFDFQETVKWGALKWENHNPGTAVEVWTRSGNSQKPVTINFISGIDLIETNNLSTNESENEGNAPPTLLTSTTQNDWSDWQPLSNDGKISTHNARFLQFALVLKPRANHNFTTKAFTGGSAMINQVEIFYGEKNTPHSITALKFYRQTLNPPLIPEEIMTSQPKGAFKIYNAEKGLNTQFSTSDKLLLSAQDPTAALFPFANLGKKIYVVEWQVENQDQDPLVYELYYRRNPHLLNGIDRNEKEWILLKKDYVNNSLQLDGYKFIDGIYQFKLVAHDGLNNLPEDSYQDEAFSIQQVIDNQPPQIENISWSGNTVKLRVIDELSIITSVKYTFDQETVLETNPTDGIYDSLKEEFSITLPEGVREVVIIAKDQADNILYRGSVKK